MIIQYRTIGVCVAHSQKLTCDDLINELNRQASANGFRVMLFTAVTEPGSEEVNSLAVQVCEAVRMKVIDALIVFENDTLTEENRRAICAEAKKNDVPVLLFGGEEEGCISLKEDIAPAFTELLRRAFEIHPFANTLLMAGNPEEDKRSLLCADIYQNAGSFTKNIIYCESKDLITVEKLEAFIRENGIPDAIFCTDDRIANSVCAYVETRESLKKANILITGIGDICTNDFFVYRYPTCRVCPADAARICVDAIMNRVSGHHTEKGYTLPMEPLFSLPGCKDPNEVLSLTLRHEKHMYSWIEKLLVSNDISLFPYMLSQIISGHSVLCLNRNARDLFPAAEPNDREYIVIPSARTNHGKTEMLYSDLRQIIPETMRYTQEESMSVLQPLSLGGKYIGYYIINARILDTDKFKYMRVMNTLKSVFQMMNLKLLKPGENGTEELQPRRNITTGLPNLFSAREWFTRFANAEDNHEKCISVSVFSMPKYNFIYENYGTRDIHDAVKFVASALEEANRDCEHYIAHISPDRFMVLNTGDTETDITERVTLSMSAFSRLLDEFNTTSKKDFIIEVNSGFTIDRHGWKENLDSYLQYAGNEMYKNLLKHGPVDAIRHARVGRDQYSTFSYLLDNGLFTYHFQPIIDAKTGSIYGYEALMRTGGGIKMSPVDVLNMAKEFGRLYDIEKTTFFGIMEAYASKFDIFRGRKLFINTIPGNFLTPEDCDRLWEKYHSLMDHFIYEITEQDSISDDELNALRRLSKDRETNQVAIDDFGTGHSNIVNLIRYTPRIVKIDRFLISNIHNDANRQMFVKNTIDFAKHNGIMVLAEGVETAEEMSAVIEYGVDLIQGYYTAKPAPEPLAALPAEIRREIIAENLRLSRYDNEMMVYEATAGEIVNIVALALRKYSYVTVPNGAITFTGEKDNTVDLVIRVPDNTECEITLENVNIRGAVETTFQIGRGSKAKIVLKGDNTLNKEGILVPPDSELILSGEGNLIINNNRNFSVGIGANYNEACGDITVDMTGELSLFSYGDKVIAIGGGKGNGGNIRLISGRISINARGINVIGIGCAKENINVTAGVYAMVNVFCSGDYAVGIGSLTGNAFIRNSGVISVTADGETAVAIGTLSGAEGRLLFSRGDVKATVHCNTGCGIGSVSGQISIENAGGRTQFYGEGNILRGFGSVTGSALCHINGGIVCGSYQAADGCVFGSRNDRFIVTSGNVLCDDNRVTMYNDFGSALVMREVNGDEFDRDVITPDGQYHYHAERDTETNRLAVYIPED
ncbi:MAG: EAL domain-containing protein [Clostridia bacterium]|nr:EAL domain-containing protein [Clostridia bacterium]